MNGLHLNDGRTGCCFGKNTPSISNRNSGGVADPLIRRFVPVTTQLTGFLERPNITAISTQKRLVFL